MLRSVKDLENYTLFATDGEIGTVVNFLLDDERWTIRYLVAETNGSAGARDVLITPISFRAADWATRCFRLGLSREKVRNSPGIDTNQPVSRQHEMDYFRYYGYPCYWGGTSLWGLGTSPAVLAAGRWEEVTPAPVAGGGKRNDDRHLCSVSEVRGCHVEGLDDAIGHVDDFIVDDTTWEIRYLVVETGNWRHGRKVLVEPRRTIRASWAERRIFFDLSCQAIKDGPPWDGADTVDRRYEAQLCDHYGRPANRGGGDGPAEAAPPQHADRGRA